MFFLPSLQWIQQRIVKTLFVTFLIVTNIVGVKAAGKINDFLTLINLVPLVLFSAVGLLYIISNPAVASQNLQPFSPLDQSDFGPALVLIFWAYAGFEISTIPAMK